MYAALLLLGITLLVNIFGALINTGFLYVDTTQGGRTGYLVEFGNSRQLFEDANHAHTKAYIRGEFS